MAHNVRKAVSPMSFEDTRKAFDYGVAAYGYQNMLPRDVVDHMQERIPEARATDKQVLAFRIAGAQRGL